MGIWECGRPGPPQFSGAYPARTGSGEMGGVTKLPRSLGILLPQVRPQDLPTGLLPAGSVQPVPRKLEVPPELHPL